MLTEDEQTRGIETILWSSGFDQTQTTILSYFGATTIRYLRPLVKVIKASNSKAKIVVHRDRDYWTDSEVQEWERNVRALKAEPFVTDGLDIEAYFLDPKHLAKQNSQCDEKCFVTLIKNARKNRESDLLARYVNGRVAAERKFGNAAKINHGKIAADAQAALNKEPGRWSNGKPLLRELRTIFQSQYAENLKVYATSAHAKDSSLELYAKKIFGSNT